MTQLFEVWWLCTYKALNHQLHQWGTRLVVNYGILVVNYGISNPIVMEIP